MSLILASKMSPESKTHKENLVINGHIKTLSVEMRNKTENKNAIKEFTCNVLNNKYRISAGKIKRMVKFKK